MSEWKSSPANLHCFLLPSLTQVSLGVSTLHCRLLNKYSSVDQVQIALDQLISRSKNVCFSFILGSETASAFLLQEFDPFPTVPLFLLRLILINSPFHLSLSVQ